MTSPPAGSCHTESLEQRRLGASGALTVAIGDGAPRSARFVDPDGTAVIVSMYGGTATLEFAGEELSQTVERRAVGVSGTGITLVGVAAAGTSLRSGLTIGGAGGDGRMVVGGMSADGPLKRITANQTVLTGTLATAGPVQRVQLLRTENASIQLGAGSGSSRVAITDAAIDTDLTSGASLRRLDIGSWGGNDSDLDTISAPSIAKAVCGGVFIGDIDVASAGRLQFNSLQNTTIRVAGSLGLIDVESALDVLVDVAGDIATASFQSVGRTRVYAGVRSLPPDSPIPASPLDFVSDSSIQRLWVSGASATGSVFAARFIRKAILPRVPSLFAPSTFVVADRIDRLRGSVLNVKSLEPISGNALDNEVRTLGAVEVRAI